MYSLDYTQIPLGVSFENTLHPTRGSANDFFEYIVTPQLPVSIIILINSSGDLRNGSSGNDTNLFCVKSWVSTP